jgi:hypothetical protein
MRIVGTTVSDITHIVDKISRERYASNVVIDTTGSGDPARFTLRTIDSRGPGSRRSPSNFRLKNGSRRPTRGACWHAHGHVFDAILAAYPDARIQSAGRVITQNGGNWQDWNAGTPAADVKMSELCDCDGPL